MELWPAIAILDGRCVRLRRGDFGDETRFGDPIEVASRYLAEGARRLHVVDLDAARSGSPENRAAILRIVGATGLMVQAGGGVRSIEAAEALLDHGVARVVVGTAALTEDQTFLDALLDRWPNRIVVGLDYRAEHDASGTLRRQLAVGGWAEKAGMSLETALTRLAALPVAAIAVTDIDRDGTGSGPDLAEYRQLLEDTELPVIASGGVGSEADIARLSRLTEAGRGLAGVIVGRALLSGALTIADAERSALGLTR
jgi:phosphoribosylformimino-5-aminoimidazole carboxamide ribotide isomerase